MAALRSAVRRLVESLIENLVWWLVAAVVAGLVAPGPATALGAHTAAILAVMIGGLGLSLPLGRLTAGFVRLRVIAIGLGAQLVSTPLLAFLAWQATSSSATTRGVVIQSVAPAEITSPLMAHLAGGSLTASVSILGVSTLLAPLTMPLLLEAILGRSVPIPAGDLLTTLGVTVAVPLLVGATVHSIAPSDRRRVLERGGPALSAGMVTLLIYAVAGVSAERLTARPVQILGPALTWSVAVLAVGLAAGWVAGRLARLDMDDSRAVLFTTGMREFGIATAVALGYFNPAVAAFPAVYGMVMMIVTARLARRLRRRPPSDH